MIFKKTIVAGVLLAFLAQASVFAAERFFIDKKIKGYEQGDFVVLDADEINFRERAVDGKVLKVLPHHSLLRVLKQDGDWLEAESDGVTGFIYAPFTSKGAKDELTKEDFIQGYAALGQRFDLAQAEVSLGKVEKTVANKKHKQTTYIYENVELGVVKQQITFIRVKDAKYITMRGVSVGDSAGRAVGQYGVPDAVIYDDGLTTYEYFMPDDKKTQLRFALEINAAGKVQAFVLERMAQK